MSKYRRFHIFTYIFILSTAIFYCQTRQTERIQITLEMDMKDLLYSLAKNKDEHFNKALEMAAEEGQHPDVDLISMLAIKAKNMNIDLAQYYGSKAHRKQSEIISYLYEKSNRALDQTVEVLRKRVKQFGIWKFSIQKQGNKLIIIELADVTDSKRLRTILSQTALLEFRLLKDQFVTQNVASKINEFIQGKLSDTDVFEKAESKENDIVRGEDLFGELEETNADTTENNSLALERDKLFKANLFFAYPGDPQRLLVPQVNETRLKRILEDPTIQNMIQTEGGDAEFMWGKLDPEGEYYGIFLVNKEPELTGETITDAFPQRGSGYDTGAYSKFEISITFNDEGARIFSRVTGANINKRLAIILDKKVHSAPTIQAKIRDGRARITGLETLEEAQDLAIVLKSGALPFRLHIIGEKILMPKGG